MIQLRQHLEVVTAFILTCPQSYQMIMFFESLSMICLQEASFLSEKAYGRFYTQALAINKSSTDHCASFRVASPYHPYSTVRVQSNARNLLSDAGMAVPNIGGCFLGKRTGI